jgi:hypothetical protein
MKQERVILSFIMVLIGLLVAGSAFYFYQSGKQIKPTTSNIATSITPTPTEKPKIYLVILNPQNEEVVSNKTLTISGKTAPNATIIVITKIEQQVFQPSSQGNFSTTVTLSSDQNLINIQAILPNGESQKIQRTVTYSTSNF